MNRLQRIIYNDGERLVPYVSHDDNELVRHRSSYVFFHTIINYDLTCSKNDSGVSIVDLGFGSGYGCALLSSLSRSRIVGVDITAECEDYARQYFPRSNVDYLIADLSKFIPEMEPFDYVVSRGVLEHVPNGLDLIKQIKFRHRVMIDVPYDEKQGNEYHVLTGIKEDAFASLDNCEFFYEDIDGQIYDAEHRPSNVNMIMLVLSSPELPKVTTLFDFPLPPVYDNYLEFAGETNMEGRCYQYETPEELLSAVEKAVKKTEVVLDIGCGLRPMNYFRPKLHLMVEPWQEYSRILAYRYADDKSVIILRVGALEAIRQLADNSVDSIFLLDVIEHLDKDEGRLVICDAERVAREQIVLFTPLGFMPQHLESGDSDGWGLSGLTVQEHRSGWDRKDFSKLWTLYICEEFHAVDHKGRPLEQKNGAFFAIRNFERKIIPVPEVMPDIRLQLPSEREVLRLQEEIQEARNQCQVLKDLYAGIESEHQTLLNSRSMRVVRTFKRVLHKMGMSRFG